MRKNPDVSKLPIEVTALEELVFSTGVPSFVPGSSTMPLPLPLAVAIGTTVPLLLPLEVSEVCVCVCLRGRKQFLKPFFDIF